MPILRASCDPGNRVGRRKEGCGPRSRPHFTSPKQALGDIRVTMVDPASHLEFIW